MFIVYFYFMNDANELLSNCFCRFLISVDDSYCNRKNIVAYFHKSHTFHNSQKRYERSSQRHILYDIYLTVITDSISDGKILRYYWGLDLEIS